MQGAVIVDACRRTGQGGSPTVVLEDGDFTDAERREVPGAMGTSHAVFIRPEGDGVDGRPAFSLRFFTSEDELPACGHGTVAALALLAEGADELRAVLHTANRRFDGWAVRESGRLTAMFDPGPVSLRAAESEELQAVVASLGLDEAAVAGPACVASVGRERLLLPVGSRAALAAVTPDFAALRAACDRHGFLGCYLYSVPDADGSAAARMFAPSIGVPEDVANANSTGCLAAHLAEQGVVRLSVDMGDRLGRPSTIAATVHEGPDGRRIRLGGEAALRG
jgi:trans-2,3-dihydro-3-hydroxyanthranilate isomerase